jgi:hypothetical protein
MAKNKNRKQTGRHQLPHRLKSTGGAPISRSGAEQTKAAVTEGATDLQTETPGGSAHPSRTKQRRFGHN